MADGSITHWVAQVKAGGESAAERELWGRYFSRLAALARRKLEDLPPHARDDEDLALSALNTFFVRAKHNGFPLLHDRTDLWQLLAKITVRKAIDRRRKANAQKRDVGKVHDNSEVQQVLRDLTLQQPTPDMLAVVNEQYQLLMGALDEELRLVARMKLDGYTNSEIAKQLGRVERTVERKLDRIRQTWAKGVD